MRISGAVPFSQQAVPVQLAGGEVFYVPPGNYDVNLGNQTVLQYLDSNNYVWRNVGFPGGYASVLSCDGFNYRLVNLSGVVAALSITNRGSGATTNGIGTGVTGVQIGFGAAPANGIAAAAYPIIGGQINTTITITQAGSGFVYPPLLLLDPPPPGGIQATASCTISGGAINAVTVTNPGAGYSAVPNVYVVPQYLTYQGVGQPVNASPPTSVIPPGIIAGIQPPFLPGVQWPNQPTGTGGALLTVNPTLAGSGTLTGAVMTVYGVGYTGTTIPSVTFSGGGLAGGVAATAVMSMAVISLGTGGTPGAGYTVGAPWISDTGQLVNTDGCNGVFQPRPARGRIAATTGFTGTPAVVEDNGFGLQTVPNIGVTQFGAAITTGSTTTAVTGGVTDVSILSPGVAD